MLILPAQKLRRKGRVQAAVATLSSGSTPTLADRQELAQWVHERLCAEYGAPFRFFSTKDPLSELVSALLSHRTRNQDSHRAYQQLRARFPTWDEVRDAPTAEVEEALSPCTWPEQKAPRQRCHGGPCDLAFLAEMPIPEARAWLEAIPGVGPKTSAAGKAREAVAGVS